MVVMEQTYKCLINLKKKHGQHSVLWNVQQVIKIFIMVQTN